MTKIKNVKEIKENEAVKDTAVKEEAKKVIKIVKVDTNADGVEDYFALLGEPKYEEVDTSKVEIFKSINSNLEMYNNFGITETCFSLGHHNLFGNTLF